MVIVYANTADATINNMLKSVIVLTITRCIITDNIAHKVLPIKLDAE